jgi:signal transduction histidine kinase
VVSTRTAVRLAWGIGSGCLVFLVSSLALLALDWKAIDSVATAQLSFFAGAATAGTLGLLIASRQPRNPIGWLLLVAWGIGAFCLAALIASVVLLALDAKAIDSIFTAQLAWFLNCAITTVLGVLIATRRPHNPIGWLLLAIAFGNAVYLPTDFIAMYGLLHGVALSGWVEWPAWIFNWTGGVGAFLLMILIFVFPDGSLPGPRWRWVAYLVGVASTISTVSSMVQVAPTQLSPRLPNVPNPIRAGAVEWITNGSGPVALVMLAALLVLVITSVIVRWRRATGDERVQLRWFSAVALATIAVVLLGFAIEAFNSTVGGNIAGAGFDVGIGVAVPLTIGLAVMKYGLYNIDVFISRTLVYGSLAVFITAVYVGIAVGIGALVGSGGKPNLALSILATAIVAIGFQPVRERLQKVANRLVYGKRATPYEVLSEFSGRVAETYAADEVLPRMARVLQEGTGAESATVWLRGMAELRPAATCPDGTTEGDPLPMSNGSLPILSGATRAVEVRHQGELLGALSVNKRRGETLTPIEQKLIDDLAHQAGLVLKNVGLSADLHARLDELRASRQRLVHAQDVERRRLERNLHDGAQQHLVALKVKLGLAEMLVEKDPAKAALTVAQLKSDADEALETLRDLARGIYPPLLADKGLVVALESQARKATLPVAVHAEGVGRYAQDVEATVYFCVLEALQNAQKYARASRASVCLSAVGETLDFAVEDDGVGFEAATVKAGAGITNMTDRVHALDGSVEVVSEPGAGTRVHCTLTVRPAVATAVERSLVSTPSTLPPPRLPQAGGG